MEYVVSLIYLVDARWNGLSRDIARWANLPVFVREI